MSNVEGKEKYSYRIKNIWYNVSIAIGALIIMVVISNFVTPFILPLFSFLLSSGLFSYVRYQRNNNTTCTLLPFIVGRSLFAYTLVVSSILIYYLIRGEEEMLEIFNPLNLQLPYFPVLLISPLVLINVIIIGIQRNKCMFCTFCILRNGTPSERSLAGRIHSREMTNIGTHIIISSSILSIGGWIYFIFLYNSVSINTFDVLVFTGVPIIFWSLVEISVGIRCWVLSEYWSKPQNRISEFKLNTTLMRYLIVNDNSVLLSPMTLKTRQEREVLDTPVTKYIPFESEVSHYESMNILGEFVSSKIDDLKLLYTNTDIRNNCSIRHYVCYTEDKSISENFGGEWVHVDKLFKMFQDRRFNLPLRNEIFRIYTVIMTLKTYSKSGKRLYKIKGYKPVFDINEIRNNEIDFSDSNIMLRSVQNEDNRFFWLTRYWYKYIEGIID